MKLRVKGDVLLKGEVDIKGSKNASLPIICASLFFDNVILKNVPDIEDVRNLIHILKRIGVKVSFKENILHLNSTDIEYSELLFKEVSSFRASYYLIGVFLAKYNRVKSYYPGGCNLGMRAIDIHLNIFKSMNYDISENEHILEIEGDVRYNNIHLKGKSVGATINAILANINTDKDIRIYNALIEPEIEDVIKFLNKGLDKSICVGDQYIEIHPYKVKNDIVHSVIPDRIETATYLFLGALCAEKLVINKCNPRDLRIVLQKLDQTGCKFFTGIDNITVYQNNEIKGTIVHTDVYPGFPTDVQQVFTSYLAFSEEISYVEERIFENRFSHIAELNKLGLNINQFNNFAIINPYEKSSSNTVSVWDLRCSAALLIAALKTKGTTVINNIDHLFRGYDNIIENLDNIGASVTLE